MFTSLDTDKSGFIEKEELQAAVQNLGISMSPKDVNNMMTDLDKNKDNKISLEEFSSWWLTGR